MLNFLKRFERYIVLCLLGMMVMVVVLSTVELAVILVEQMVKPPKFILLDINEMLKIFGFFLMILIALEMVEVIKAYLVDDSVHCEIVFLVAIIAMTRKVIILDVKTLAPLTIIGVATIILALSVGYYVLKKAVSHKTLGHSRE